MVSDCSCGCKREQDNYLEVERKHDMVSDCGHTCKESRTTYSLKVEREHDGVRLRL
jgi:hypothetical protein